ncbi:hypothetical protein BDZ89DRAFT_1039308 [Hymenopellis radicata]|nr:hypothetical protein BDZ89DRAFT_1039308 [Hymenopellis radicata]
MSRIVNVASNGRAGPEKERDHSTFPGVLREQNQNEKWGEAEVGRGAYARVCGKPAPVRVKLGHLADHIRVTTGWGQSGGVDTLRERLGNSLAALGADVAFQMWSSLYDGRIGHTTVCAYKALSEATSPYEQLKKLFLRELHCVERKRPCVHSGVAGLTAGLNAEHRTSRPLPEALSGLAGVKTACELSVTVRKDLSPNIIPALKVTHTRTCEARHSAGGVPTESA